MFDTLREIHISDIDIRDERYRISPESENISFLSHSIKKMGLMNPPVVRPMDDGKFILISGFNRIKALQQNNESKVRVRSTDTHIDDYHCLLFAVATLAFKRPLTQVELIISIKRLSRYLDREDMTKISSAVFNTQLAQEFIDDLMNIGSLPSPALKLIHTGQLSLKSAKKLVRLDLDAISFFLDIFSKIRASASVQLELIQNILETSLREGVHPKSLFQELNLPNPLDGETVDMAIRTHHFRTLVFEQRYPVLSRTRQAVQDKIASVKLPGTIKLIPPENFESRKYSISFTVKNHEEFEKNIQHLTDALENMTLREILDS
ncbi:MAG: ParB N-terminal domain-containing protein [Desulfobacula sp.]|nr:ParB N-terminal domain-containing protein [Desulfobacula sp.]